MVSCSSVSASGSIAREDNDDSAAAEKGACSVDAEGTAGADGAASGAGDVTRMANTTSESNEATAAKGASYEIDAAGEDGGGSEIKEGSASEEVSSSETDAAHEDGGGCESKEEFADEDRDAAPGMAGEPSASSSASIASSNCAYNSAEVGDGGSEKGRAVEDASANSGVEGPELLSSGFSTSRFCPLLQRKGLSHRGALAMARMCASQYWLPLPPSLLVSRCLLCPTWCVGCGSRVRQEARRKVCDVGKL